MALNTGEAEHREKDFFGPSLNLVSRLLSADEHAVFRRLGVFVGGWDLEAASAVVETVSPGADPLETMASLVDKGLVQAYEPSPGVPRFRLLETIREYAVELLETNGELSDMWRRHALFYLAMAEEGEPKLHAGEQEEWLARLERDHDNLRSALTWSQSGHGELEVGWRLGWALGWFWHLHGHYHEGRAWLEQMLETSRLVPPQDRARLMVRTGTLTYLQGDLARAELLLENGIAISRAGGDIWTAALGLGVLGYVRLNQGRFRDSEASSAEALRLFESLADRWGIAWAQHGLGRAAYDQGDYERASIHLEESLATRRDLQDIWGLSLGLHFVGRVAYARGELERARALQEESLGLAQRVAAKRYIAWTLQHLGHIALASGEHMAAADFLRESLASAMQRGDKLGVVDCIESLGALAACQGRPQVAATLFGAGNTCGSTLRLERSFSASLSITPASRSALAGAYKRRNRGHRPPPPP